MRRRTGRNLIASASLPRRLPRCARVLKTAHYPPFRERIGHAGLLRRGRRRRLFSVTYCGFNVMMVWPCLANVIRQEQTSIIQEQTSISHEGMRVGQERITHGTEQMRIGTEGTSIRRERMALGRQHLWPDCQRMARGWMNDGELNRTHAVGMKLNHG